MKLRGGILLLLASLTATIVLTFPHQPNRVEIDLTNLRERRTLVWLGIPGSTTTYATWLTPTTPPTSEHWVTIRNAFLAPGARTLPELEPVARIGHHLDRLSATDEERTLIVERVCAIVSDTRSPWHDRRNRLALAANPLTGEPSTVSDLLTLLPAP